MSTYLNILTYNTHLFYDTIAAKLDHSLVHEDTKRITGISKRLQEDAYDVACLNEVWDDAIKKHFYDDLVTTYPSCASFDDPIINSAPDNGLLILSSSLLVDTSFTRYEDLTGWDALSRKGFLCTKVLLKNESGDYVPVYVFCTHTQADDPDDCYKNLMQLRDAVKNIAWGYYPIVILGDLNTVAEDVNHQVTNSYRQLLELFQPYQFSDLYRSIFPNAAADPGYTSDGVNNELHKIFNPSDTSQTRIDYILVNSKFDIGGSTVEIPTDYKYIGTNSQGTSGLVDLSDHYPLRARLKLA